jgi:hypothetical protein
MKSQPFIFFSFKYFNDLKLKINKIEGNDQHFIPSGVIVTGDNPFPSYIHKKLFFKQDCNYTHKKVLDLLKKLENIAYCNGPENLGPNHEEPSPFL